MQIRGKRALVTGASGGLGEAIARALHERGAELVLHGRRKEQLDKLAAELNATVEVADLAIRPELEGLASRCEDVDILVGNAGIGGSGRVVDLAVGDIDTTIEVNLTANVHLARVIGAKMKSRGSGHMVFVGSLAGKATGAGSALYSASKFGLRGFVIALRDEMSPEGVGVGLVQPGFVRDAGMFADGGAELPPGVGTVTPGAVADGVIQAIEKDRGMVTVAPLAVRAGADFANAAPTVAMWIANATPLGKVKAVADD